jgi:hypothetical protein
MARTQRERPRQSEATKVAGATTAAQLPLAAEERRTVLLQPEHEGDAEALLRALIVIARRVASERQTVVESSEAGELAA